MYEISIIDRQEGLCDSGGMADAPENPAIYDALLAVKPEGLTLNAWTVKAGLNRSVFHDIRRNGNASHSTIQKLLDAAGVSLAEFEGRMPANVVAAAEAREEMVADPFRVFRHDRPKNVPVRGTPSCGEMVVKVDGEEMIVETIEMDLDEIIDFVRRPAALDGRRDVYAIYPQGFSMVPRYEPGEVAYVDGKRPPSIGDYVVVQLRKADEHNGERIVSALLKRLVRQSAEWIELEQFNPERVFRIERRRIAVMHRIFPLAELVGI